MTSDSIQCLTEVIYNRHIYYRIRIAAVNALAQVNIRVESSTLIILYVWKFFSILLMNLIFDEPYKTLSFLSVQLEQLVLGHYNVVLLLLALSIFIGKCSDRVPVRISLAIITFHIWLAILFRWYNYDNQLKAMRYN